MQERQEEVQKGIESIWRADIDLSLYLVLPRTWTIYMTYIPYPF